jgi:hypothetical protein
LIFYRWNQIAYNQEYGDPVAKYCQPNAKGGEVNLISNLLSRVYKANYDRKEMLILVGIDLRF